MTPPAGVRITKAELEEMHVLASVVPYAFYRDHVPRLISALTAARAMATSLHALMTTIETDEDGNVTPEWNDAYGAAKDALAAFREKVEE